MPTSVDFKLRTAALDALPVEIALVDQSGEIQFVNEVWKTFADANGATHDTYWVGENYLEVCNRADGVIPMRVRDNLQAVLAGEQNGFRLEYPCHVSPEQRWFLLEATSVDHEGDRYGIVTHIDITDRKQAQLQRDSHITQLETIISILSHDLRNPLTIIRGYAENLHTTDVDPELAEAIQESTDRMSELITTTLRFARTQGVNEVDRCPVADIAKNAWEQTPTADASLEIETACTVVADASLFQQAFENLFRNAVEHGGSSVTIRVGATDEGVYVEDTGSGIPTAKRRELLAQNMSHEEETDLGFAIVRAIVTAHGWTLSLHEGSDGGARIEMNGIGSIRFE